MLYCKQPFGKGRDEIVLCSTSTMLLISLCLQAFVIGCTYFEDAYSLLDLFGLKWNNTLNGIVTFLFQVNIILQGTCQNKQLRKIWFKLRVNKGNKVLFAYLTNGEYSFRNIKEKLTYYHNIFTIDIIIKEIKFIMAARMQGLITQKTPEAWVYSKIKEVP